jgi:hypothetical protein
VKNIYCISFLLIILFTNKQSAVAQIDLQCNGRDMHSIYLILDSGFFRIDSVDTNPTDPIFVSSNIINAQGISINDNLDSISGQVTIYSINYCYFYWNGTGWTNTGHIAGSSNPGGSSKYIFNIDGNANTLYRYDGTGNDILLLSNLVTSVAAVYDVACDNMGAFYLFFTNNQKIIAYDPNGIQIDFFNTSGFPVGVGAGLAILGDKIYAMRSLASSPGSSYLYQGTKSGALINFTLIKSISSQCRDIASCPNAAFPLAIFKNPELPHFAVYPNPASCNVVIKLENTSSLEIYNCIGIVKETIATYGLNEYILDISQWKRGVYIINALSEKKCLLGVS